MKNIIILISVVMFGLTSCSKVESETGAYLEGDWSVYKVETYTYNKDRELVSEELPIDNYVGNYEIKNGVVTTYPELENTEAVKFYFSGNIVKGNLKKGFGMSKVADKVSETEIKVDVPNSTTGLYIYVYLRKQ